MSPEEKDVDGHLGNGNADDTQTTGVTVVLIDETGDMGASDRYFAVTALVSNCPEKLAEIAWRHPPDTRKVQKGNDGELKFVTSDRTTRVAVLEELVETDPHIYAVATNKGSSKRNGGWPRSGPDLYVRSVELLLKMVSEAHDGELHVYFDEQSALKREDAVRMCSESTIHGKNNIVCINHSIRSEDEPMMQTNDFIPGAIGFEFARRRGYAKTDDFDYLPIFKMDVKMRRK